MKPAIYTLSDSDSESDKEQEIDELLLGSIYAPLSKKQEPPLSPVKKNSKKKDAEKAKLSEEKLRLKEKKQKILEEKAKLKEEKCRQKEEKKKTSEYLKRLQPGECMKYVNVVLDSDLLNCKFGGELLMAIQTGEIQYKVQEQKIRHSITWIRKLEDSHEKKENYLMIIWTGQELVNLISSNSLDSTVKTYLKDHPNFHLTLVIFGVEEYFRLQKTIKNRKYKNKIVGEEGTSVRNDKEQNLPSIQRIDIEMSLGELQLLHNIQYRFVETNQDVGLVVVQFTKSLAELPFKLERNKKHENTDWYATADSRESVKVDSNGNGLLRLWQQQICQFPNVGFDIAQAIVSEYSSPRELMEAYDRCSDKKKAELLLQDIPVRRAQGPLTSVRRIGPELSKKMFMFFNNFDGNVLIS